MNSLNHIQSKRRYNIADAEKKKSLILTILLVIVIIGRGIREGCVCPMARRTLVKWEMIYDT